MSAWFKRKEKGIQTATEEKKDTPKGLWYKSPTGKIVESDELAKNFYVSPEDDYHVSANSIHVNTYFSYAREWQITKGTAALSFAFQPQVALGTRDIYLQPGTVFYIGKKNHLSKSIAYDRLGSSSVKELYVALKTSYRQVLYNGLIEGNLFGDTSSFVTDSQNALWRFGADLYHRSNKNDYKIGFYFNTQETSKSNSHQYLLLAYAYQF